MRVGAAIEAGSGYIGCLGTLLRHCKKIAPVKVLIRILIGGDDAAAVFKPLSYCERVIFSAAVIS